MKLGFNQEYIHGWKNALSKADKTAVNELSKAGYKAALSNQEVVAKYQGKLFLTMILLRAWPQPRHMLMPLKSLIR